jgi:hypothetical protein
MGATRASSAGCPPIWRWIRRALAACSEARSAPQQMLPPHRLNAPRLGSSGRVWSRPAGHAEGRRLPTQKPLAPGTSSTTVSTVSRSPS